jgi:hypothetical protein
MQCSWRGGIKAVIVVLGLLGLSACATTTPYQAAARPGGFGFTETQMEPNRFALTFSGNSSTPREQVENAALFRAAELTLAAGFDHFIVAARATDADTRVMNLGPRSPLWSDYWAFDPRFGWRPYGSSFGGPFWRDRFADDWDTRTLTSFRARLEFVMAKGPKPAADPQAFDAAASKQNLEAKIIRPAPKP